MARGVAGLAGETGKPANKTGRIRPSFAEPAGPRVCAEPASPTTNESGVDPCSLDALGWTYLTPRIINYHMSQRVYLIRYGDSYFKIGTTTNVQRRLREVQTHCPLPCKIVVDRFGGRELEKLLLLTFKSRHVRGEWFLWDSWVPATARSIIGPLTGGRMASIGRKLRTKRLERDVTQAQLAKTLSTEQSMIAMVEAGTATPGDELLGRMNRWLASGGTAGRAKRGAYKRTKD